jgi:hypothetical protein
MTIEALVRYRVFGDEYIYIEHFTFEYKSFRVNFAWRPKIVQALLKQGVVLKEIDDIQIKYKE